LQKDWKAADEAREELARKGIIVIDTENGPVWKRARDIE
jgi:cysteinyl-tRNA synthetase